jgi:hypothetical protein
MISIGFSKTHGVARFPWVQLVLGSTSQNFVEQNL